MTRIPAAKFSPRQDDVISFDIDLTEMSSAEVDVAAPFVLAAAEPGREHAPTLRQRVAAQLPAGFGNGLMLALRFLQARFLSVWGLFVAAALCPVQVFTDFAIFSTLAAFLSIAALLRYDAVFFQNNDRRRLGQAFRLALAVAAIFLGLSTLAVLFAAEQGWVLRGFGALFLVSLGARTLVRLLLAEATAEGDFATVGNINVVQALVQPGLMILLIWPLGPISLALFTADAFGHLVSACYLIWRRREALVRLLNPADWSARELWLSALRWRKAPAVLLPSTLLAFGFMVSPLLALPMVNDAVFAAHVALAMRLFEMPTQMFVTVSVPLAMNTLRGLGGQERQRAARVITLRLVAVAGALYLSVALVAMVADFVFDGTQWEGVGNVVALLALFYGGSALVTPLHEITTLSYSPHRQLVTNACALGATGLLIAWFGTLSPALLVAIGLVSVARMFAHIQFAWTRLGAAPPLGASASRAG